MEVGKFIDALGVEFFSGVPDSQLKEFCDYLVYKYRGDSKHHIVAANEGNAVAMAAGYHLATGKYPLVYLQNSGIGNIVNPVASLLNNRVYGIPCIFVVGWRGEPGLLDEPQHLFQGEITLNQLKTLDISCFILDSQTTLEELKEVICDFSPLLKSGKQVAFVVRKKALTTDCAVSYGNDYSLTREIAIQHIVVAAGDNPIISTTGKASRELFEIREANSQKHDRDFLTVGSMGHASSIALGIAKQQPNKRIWIIDGDGSVLMHMGAMAVIGSLAPENIVHVVINNEAHESVGGMPTVAGRINLTAIAKACGYRKQCCVSDTREMDNVLSQFQQDKELVFLEVKCAQGARKNLGRPTLSAKENKVNFMNYLIKNV